MTGKTKSEILTNSQNPMMDTFRRGLLQGVGIDTLDLAKRPLIAIANSHSELTTGHSHLATLATRVKEGILIAGGRAVEFNVPAPCDGVAMGHDGMRYILAQRDLIADMVETHVRSQRFDGVVMIAGCDKINPGMMMAAARLDLPAIYLAGGPGMWDIRNRTGFKGSIDHFDYPGDKESQVATIQCATCGACEIMGTANTFQCLAEAMGICLPGSSNVPGFHTDKLRYAEQTGRRIVAMVQEGLNFSKILTWDALMNAMVMNMAIGGSTNATLHLPAIAHSAGFDLPLSLFDEYSRKIPTLLAVAPNGPWGITDIWAAGGMPAVLKMMAEDLNLDCLSVSGQTLGEIVERARVRNPLVIPERSNAFRATGGIAVLTGNLAPDGCVIKAAGIKDGKNLFTGPALCFDNEDAVAIALREKRIPEGTVIVIRYAGPRGGPGMPEMLGVTTMIRNFGLNAAVVTDGRYSGATSGYCVGHVSPEAASGGPIGAVLDGDQITIDVEARTLNLHLTDEEIATRLSVAQHSDHDVPRGFLQRYKAHVSSAATGAVLT